MNKCKYCNKETKNAKFCSRSCAAKENNKIPKRQLIRKCTHCDTIVRNYRSTLCEKHFQEELKNKKEFILNSTLEYYYNKKSLKELHSSSKAAHIRGLARSWFKDLTKLPCAKCGYNKHVELCHIKSISSFPKITKLKEVNCKENLIQLCPNCHWELDNLVLPLASTPEPTL